MNELIVANAIAVSVLAIFILDIALYVSCAVAKVSERTMDKLRIITAIVAGIAISVTIMMFCYLVEAVQ